MATSLEQSEKLNRIEEINANTFHLVKKIMKISPVYTEIALLIVKKINKKEEITEDKIYNPVGNSAERAKLMQAKYIARWASLPSGLNESDSERILRIDGRLAY